MNLKEWFFRGSVSTPYTYTIHSLSHVIVTRSPI
jgi:hypothetical protein